MTSLLGPKTLLLSMFCDSVVLDSHEQNVNVLSVEALGSGAVVVPYFAFEPAATTGQELYTCVENQLNVPFRLHYDGVELTADSALLGKYGIAHNAVVSVVTLNIIQMRKKSMFPYCPYDLSTD